MNLLRAVMIKSACPTGDAGGMVAVANELEHQQTGAKEEPAGRLGRSELV